MIDIPAPFLHIKACQPKAIAPGSMLVAEPFMSEIYFKHAVAMVVDYSDTDGVLGLVMNNPTNLTLDKFLDEARPEAEIPVYCGGPMGQDRVVVMHTLGDRVLEGAKEFAPGLYLGGDFDAALDYANSGYPLEGELRFIIGYCGWDSVQLAEEIRNQSWAVTDAPQSRKSLLTGDGDHYYHRFVRSMGAPYRPWQFIPRHLSAN